MWQWITRILPFFGGSGMILAAVLGIAWLVSEREQTVCLTYLEVAGVSLIVSVALELARRAPPP